MDDKLALLLLFPLAWPFIAKKIWNMTITWKELLLNIVIVAFVVIFVWELGKFGQTGDTEILNGSVVSKVRKHGSYIESYDCNCREVCSGSGSQSSCTTQCDTCYRDHYTVTWIAETTLGAVRFDHKDWTSRAVYALPDPPPYTNCIIGEPASLEHRYVNYVLAVPESLFNNKKEANFFKDKIPTYPRVHSFYKIDRVINVGSKMSLKTQKEISDRLSHSLIRLGSSKEVNVIMIVTSITDPSYRYAVENAWIGAKKNDVVIFIGLEDENIIWADVMTWARNSKNEFLQVKLRDGLKELKVVDAKVIAPFIEETIKKHYNRPHMSDYEYLKDSIEPPLWVMVLAIIFSVIGSLGLSYFFHRNETF